MRRFRILLAVLVALVMVFSVAGIGLAGDNTTTTDSIQYALDAADEGATIEIQDETYEEHIVIGTKNITLRAPDGATIQGSITIMEADGVTVEGFTVLGDGDGVIIMNSGETTVKDMTIIGCGVGILLIGDSNGADIQGNEFSSNDVQLQDDGEDLDLDAVIAENAFDRAVVVRGSDIKVPTIFSSIQDAVNEAEAGDTVEVYPGTYVENVRVETDEGNDRNGLVVTSTEADSRGANTVVKAATTDQDGSGVFIIEADDVTVRGFTITEGRNGISVTGDGNVIAYNTITEQEDFNGVVVHSGEGNVIECNHLTSNLSTGIYIKEFASATEVRDNVISGNNAEERDGAIEVEGEGTVVRFNCIVDNNKHGIYSHGAEVFAEFNWWGDKDGPDVDAVSDTVVFDPWLSRLEYTGDDVFVDPDVELKALLLASDGEVVEGVAGITVHFYIDDEYVGDATTEDDGIATLLLENHYVGQDERDITVKAVGCMTDIVEVSFEQEIEIYTLTVDMTGDGTVELDGEKIDDFPHAVQYERGIKVDLVAIPEAGYRFSGWYGDVHGADRFESNITLVMDGDLEVEARFLPEDAPDDPDEDVPVRINPRVINLRARGVVSAWILLPKAYDTDDVSWVELGVNGDSVTGVWTRMANRVLMVKFDGAEVADMLSIGDRVDLWIKAYVGGTLYGGSDTVRVILPGVGPLGLGPPGESFAPGPPGGPHGPDGPGPPGQMR